MRSTKIVATLGPSSSQKHEIATLVDAGVNVFRLNFSHGSHEEQAERVQNIREIEAETGRPVAILADMQGPKYRIGAVNAPFQIAEGQTVWADRVVCTSAYTNLLEGRVGRFELFSM